MREMAKPLARYADDEDLNRLQKARILPEDPMAAYMLEQQEQAMAASGKPQRRKYQGQAPPNRFNIAPGTTRRGEGGVCVQGRAGKGGCVQSMRRGRAVDSAVFLLPRAGYSWDGRDRSNGFEAKWFKKQVNGKALQTEAYKWSTSDM